MHLTLGNDMWVIHGCSYYMNAGEVLALRHTKEAELLPAPAVIGEAVILRDQLPAASIRPCTFRSNCCCSDDVMLTMALCCAMT